MKTLFYNKSIYIFLPIFVVYVRKSGTPLFRTKKGTLIMRCPFFFILYIVQIIWYTNVYILTHSFCCKKRRYISTFFYSLYSTSLHYLLFSSTPKVPSDILQLRPILFSITCLIEELSTSI